MMLISSIGGTFSAPAPVAVSAATSVTSIGADMISLTAKISYITPTSSPSDAKDIRNNKGKLLAELARF